MPSITGIRGDRTRPNPVTSSKFFMYGPFFSFSGKIRSVDDREACKCFLAQFRVITDS